MRWDSPFVLATAGTLAVHLLLVTAGDAMVVTHPPSTRIPAPHIDLIDIEPPPVAKAQPPPPAPISDPKPAPRPQAT